MRVDLTAANTAKMLAASDQLHRSVNEIVNIVIANMQELEITEQVTIVPHDETKPGARPRAVINRSRTFRVRW